MSSSNNNFQFYIFGLVAVSFHFLSYNFNFLIYGCLRLSQKPWISIIPFPCHSIPLCFFSRIVDLAFKRKTHFKVWEQKKSLFRSLNMQNVKSWNLRWFVVSGSLKSEKAVEFFFEFRHKLHESEFWIKKKNIRTKTLTSSKCISFQLFFVVVQIIGSKIVNFQFQQCLIPIGHNL